MQIQRLVWLIAVLALMAAACGTPEQPTSTTLTTIVDPVKEPVDPFDPVDQPLPADASSGWTIAFEAGTPWGPDGHGSGGYWESGLLAGENGLLVTAIGEGEESAVIDLFRSVDGTTWALLDPVFGSLGIEYFDFAVATPDGFMLGGFTFGDEGEQVDPWMLQSTDGVEWSDADTGQGLGAIASSFIRGGPDAGIYGVISSVVRFGDRYVAGGNFEEAAVVWVSDDGTAWDQHVVAEGFGSWVTGLAVANDRIYAVGSGPAMTVWESSDGVEWTATAGPEAFGIQASTSGGGGEFEGEFFEEAFHSGNFVGLAPYRDGLAALILVQRRTGDAWCFIDASLCNQGLLELVTSTDGAEWQALPMPDDPTLVWDGSLAAVDGKLVLVEANDGQLQVWTAGDLGSASPIEVEDLPDLGFDIVRWDDTIEQGVTYGYPFWTHCGIDRLGEFNGQVWEIIDDTSHNLPEEEWSYDSELLYGTIELVAPDRIEYTLSDIVIATYSPAEDPGQELCA